MCSFIIVKNLIIDRIRNKNQLIHSQKINIERFLLIIFVILQFVFGQIDLRTFEIAEDDSLLFDLSEISSDTVRHTIADSSTYGDIYLTDSLIKYVPLPNYTGNDQIVLYRINEDTTDSIAFNIRITPVNDSPQFLTGYLFLQFDEDDTLVFHQHEWREQVFDPDTLDILNFEIVPTTNIFVETENKTSQFYSTNNWNGTDTMTVFVSDGIQSDTVLLFVEVLPTNDPPEFQKEIFSLLVLEDEEWKVNVNQWFDEIEDIDNEINELSWSVVSGHSVNAVLEDTTIIFTAQDHWFGIDSIMIFVSDGDLFDAATLEITVEPVNDPPEFVDRLPIFELSEDSEIIVHKSVFFESVHDVDMPDKELNWSFDSGEDSFFTVMGDSIKLAVDENWNGVDTIEVIASDGLLSDTSKTVVIVHPINDPPTIIDAPTPIHFLEDEMYIIANHYWLEKISDIDNSRSDLQFNLSSSKNISALKTPAGFSLIPSKNWFGLDSLLFVVSDGMLTDSAVVMVELAPVNDPPRFTQTLEPLLFDEDDSLRIFINDLKTVIHDLDSPFEDIFWTLHGGQNISYKTEDTTASLTTPRNWNGSEILSIIISDGELSDTSDITITVNPVNDPPSFMKASFEYACNEDDIINIPFSDFQGLIHDVDNQFDQITITILSSESINVERFEKNFTLSPKLNWYGTDTLTVMIFDGEYYDRNTINLTVHPINDPPILTEILPEIQYFEDHEKQIEYLDWYNWVDDIDHSDDSLQWDMLNGKFIEVIKSKTSGILVSPQNWFGNDTLSVLVNDGEYSDTTILPINILPVNDPPKLSRTLRDTAFYEDGFMNISDIRWKDYVVDPDHPFSELNWRVTGMQFLSASGSNNSIDFFTPKNWFGFDRATLLVSDGEHTDSSSFCIYVFPVNDPPKLSVIPDIIMNEDTEHNIHLEQYVQDEDDEITSLSWTTYLNESSLETKVSTDRWFYLPGRKTPSNNLPKEMELFTQKYENIQILIDDQHHLARIIPAENYHGNAIQYILKVVDAYHASDIQMINITVLPINDPPILDPLPKITIQEDELFTYLFDSLFVFVNDVDNHDSTLTWTIKPGNKLIADIKGKSFTISGNKNWYGQDSIQIYVHDESLSDTSTLVIDVLQVNDPPEPFELIGHIVGDSLNIDFQWYPSTDIDSDTVSYIFRLKGDNIDTTISDIVGKHHILFDGKDVLQTGILYEWSVNVTDGTNTIQCTNPKRFYLKYIPGDYSLSPNYPNPFNKETTIPFEVAKNGRVKIMVYDMHGKEIMKIMDDNLSPGQYDVKWDGKDKYNREVATGVYLVTMIAKDFSQVRKIMLIK